MSFGNVRWGLRHRVLFKSFFLFLSFTSIIFFVLSVGVLRSTRRCNWTAFDKPQGFCTRVAIGQVQLFVRYKDNNSHHAQEALPRAKFKFPRRQKIIVSRKCFLDVMDHWQTFNLEEHFPQK
ncbi:60S ribosomal protein L10 (Fragment) [Linum perenne]